MDDRHAYGKCCGIGTVTIACRQRNMRKGWNSILTCVVHITMAAINKMGNHRRLRRLARADAKIIVISLHNLKLPFIGLNLGRTGA